MYILRHDRFRAALASGTFLLLGACNGRLAVVGDLEPDGDSGGAASNRDGASEDWQSALELLDPTVPLNVDCPCTSSAALMPLLCGGWRLNQRYGAGTLSQDNVRISDDGSVVAFNIEGPPSPRVVYWTAGAPSHVLATSGFLTGLSATGQHLLVGILKGSGFTDVSRLDRTMRLITPKGDSTRFEMGALEGDHLLSASGDVLLGTKESVEQVQLMRGWAATGEMESLALLEEFPWGVLVTPDGSTVVGQTGGLAASPPSPVSTFRWTEQGLELDFLGQGLADPWPQAISADGSIIAGRVGPDQDDVCFRWSDADGHQAITSVACDVGSINADGSVISGLVSRDGGIVLDRYTAFRWTEATGTVELMPFVDGRRVFDTDMSADGSVIVVMSQDPPVEVADPDVPWPAPGPTFIWDEVHGTRTLDQVLQERGVDTTGWELGHARVLSANGKVLVGRATCGGEPSLYRLVLSD